MNELLKLIKSDPITKLIGAWCCDISIGSVIFRLALSLILSFALGCERSSKRHSAGLRTFVLICFSSTCASLLDLVLITSFNVGFPLLSSATVIASALLSINSVLFSSRSQIKGLTTSAGLWSSVFLGFAAGLGLYTLTIVIFIYLISILALFPSFEKYLKNRSNHFEVHLELTQTSFLQDFVSVCRKLGLRIDDIEANPAYRGSGLSVYTITLTICSAELKKFKTHKEIIEALATLNYIYHIEELN